MVVERLVSGNWSLAQVSYKTYASYCWLRVRPGENVRQMQRRYSVRVCARRALTLTRTRTLAR